MAIISVPFVTKAVGGGRTLKRDFEALASPCWHSMQRGKKLIRSQVENDKETLSLQKLSATKLYRAFIGLTIRAKMIDLHRNDYNGISNY